MLNCPHDLCFLTFLVGGAGDAQLVTEAAASFMSPRPPPPPPAESEFAPPLPTACHTVPASCKNCKCKKSRCLKLYCECFAAKEFCTGSGCQCLNCLNTVRASASAPCGDSKLVQQLAHRGELLVCMYNALNVQCCGR